MIIKVRTSADLPYSEVTPERVYRSRREFMQTAAAGAVGAMAGGLLVGGTACAKAAEQAALPAKKSAFTVDPAVDPLNTYEQITSYNNFYEFGTDKGDPARYAGRLTVKPWSVKVDGLVDKPGDYGVEDLVDFTQLEERVYRHRCVEAWSMVMPWIGVPLSSVLNKVKPKSSATFVEFTTLEVRLQERQVDRAHPADGHDAAYHVGRADPERIWLLRERQSDGRSSALEPGA